MKEDLLRRRDATRLTQISCSQGKVTMWTLFLFQLWVHSCFAGGFMNARTPPKEGEEADPANDPHLDNAHANGANGLTSGRCSPNPSFSVDHGWFLRRSSSVLFPTAGGTSRIAY